MNCFYIEAKNDSSVYVWVKFILNSYNELELSDIVKSINQYLINNNALEVFTDCPNILFVEENPVLYRNYSDKSNVKLLTTSDHTPIHTQSFNTYSSLKEALINLIVNNRKRGEDKLG